MKVLRQLEGFYALMGFFCGLCSMFTDDHLATFVAQAACFGAVGNLLILAAIDAYLIRMP